jgi:8'-apo-carotenoid 13,14-cleaving dioxygenase
MQAQRPYVDDEPMAPPTEPPRPPTNEDLAGTIITGLVVRGALPAALSGWLLGIGPDCDSDVSGFRSSEGSDGVVHSVHLHAGRVISYRTRRVITDAVAKRLRVDPSPGPRSSGPDIVAGNIVAVGGSILALGDGSLAYELTADLDTLRRVDLAGQSRGLAAFPKRDPVTGDLHILAIAATGAQAYVVVSCGALTRTSRSIAGAPERIKDLAITRDSVVFAADGFVGVTSRDGEAHTRWIATGVAAPYLVHAHDVGDTVVVHAVTPSLERWTIHAASATLHREVLDQTPRQFGRTNDQPIVTVPRFLWTTGDGTVDKHDLAKGSYVSHIFRPNRRPGDFVFIADATRHSDTDGGWLVGFVHHPAGDDTDLIVLDAADIARPAIATVRIPHRIPRGLHSTWIPSIHQ